MLRPYQFIHILLYCYLTNKLMILKNGITSLEEVLAYSNQDVVYSFIEKFETSYEEAESIFNETKKFLWACYYHRKDPKYADVSVVVEDSILIIDEMWHTFILFTSPYSHFCRKYFSEFIGHAPTTYKEKKLREEALQTRRNETLKKQRDKYKKQLSYLYDTLGEDTIKKWYLEYRDKYTRDAILAMRKK